jgi:type IV pilus assembly protein PilB
MRIPSENKFFEALVRDVRAFAPLRVTIERRRLKESGQPIIAGLLNRISPGAVEQGLIAAGIPRLSLQHIEHGLLSHHPVDEWEKWRVIPVVQPDGAWLAAAEPFDMEVHLLGKRLDVVGIGYAETEEILQALRRQTNQSPSATAPVSTVAKPLPARTRKVLQVLQLQVEIPHTAAYQVERYLIASGELTEWAVYSELSRATGWPLWADLERITVERLNITVEHLQVLLVRRGGEKYYLTPQAFIEEELAAVGLERHPVVLTYPEMWDAAYRSSQQVAETVSKPRSVLEALYRQGRIEQSFYQEWQTDPRGGENQLIARGLLSEEQFTEARAQVLKMPYIDLLNQPPEPAVRKHISDAYTLSLRAIPHHINEIGELVVVVGDPEDIQRNDELKMLLRNTPLRLALASPGAIQRIIMRNYGQQRDLQEVTTFLAGEDKGGVTEDLELEGGALDRLVNSFIREAVLSDASDIHIESHKGQGVVRMRRDGLLHEYTTLPLRSVPAVIQKIKVRAALDITERRVPQDGRFRFNDGGVEVNVRVSTVLTMYGEKAVMRLLKSEGKVPLLTEAGFQSDTLAQLRRIIQRPHGLFLITGPTGSGKTRTGIAALAELARPEVNVLTVEDPVEYEVPGINQVQVNPQAKVTFGSVLRAFLRQDPDIIYVGEIRDRETAQVATQAAFTGHLVIATLHTNDAPSSVTRLVDLGVDPANVSAALLGVLAQRLVRKVCRHCAIPDHEGRSEQLLSRPLVEAVLANPEGCRHCYSGYVGRTGIFELMEVSQEMQSLLAQGPSMDQIREMAREQGMRSLMEDGVLKVEQGVTTAEEVLAKTMV